MIMNKILLFGCAAILVLVAGCTTISSDTGSPQPASPVLTQSVPAPSETVVSNPLLPMNAAVVLGTGEKQFTASVDSFEIDPQSEPGKQTITVYVAVKNTGTVPVQLVWFSRLTDVSGRIYGGIGISHGGNGARSGLIYPNMTEAARDYVVVPEADFAQLSRGAILDVYFMEKKSDTDSISLVPDYHIRWAIDPGVLA
jgi:hypothetical protein